MKKSRQSLHGVGIGLKPQHYDEILNTLPALDWFEVHPENYMGDGGLPHKYLREITEHYPLSMHGVGLSLGSANGVNDEHLMALKKVVNRYQPAQVSEHLSWSHGQQYFLNDLLPLPYTEASLRTVIENVDKVQEVLQRTILVENPSAYLGFKHSDMTETEFLSALVKQTNCGLLLDINNIYVSANNQDFCSEQYLNDYPLHAVGEIHLAGHACEIIDNENVLIDDHGSPIIDEVWQLYQSALQQIKQAERTLPPVLIEWDTDVPELSTLLSEANKAKRLLVEHSE
ncbi:MNIO family bufferin maturase [Eionea flava]